MSRRAARVAKKKSHTGLYLLAACCVAIGALLFGLSVINTPASTETVNEVSPPETAEAPEPVEEAAEEEPAEEQEPARDEDREPAEEEPAEEEPVEEAPAEEAPVEEAPVEEAPVEEPAAIPAAAGTDLSLTVPKMGLYDDSVVNDASEATLLNGAGKVSETGFPWEDGANTYIASHVLGYSGTGSQNHFAALPNMTYGDEISLRDSNGTTYTYSVSEILTVTPYDVWVLDPTGADMVSLQTCVNPPAYDLRLVVRAERVSVDVA
ncbi:MAG: sortase [Actinomycetota bacterium]|jgi:sortase A|nr:sortase [Actinomycetota bacterium]